ncbi:MAG: hypothetical protein HY606_05030 [Planctomycetes bacterium]|nr:hypothetical protein [Planctomycetota bacterium]
MSGNKIYPDRRIDRKSSISSGATGLEPATAGSTILCLPQIHALFDFNIHDEPYKYNENDMPANKLLTNKNHSQLSTTVRNKVVTNVSISSAGTQ